MKAARVREVDEWAASRGRSARRCNVSWSRARTPTCGAGSIDHEQSIHAQGTCANAPLVVVHDRNDDDDGWAEERRAGPSQQSVLGRRRMDRRWPKLTQTGPNRLVCPKPNQNSRVFTRPLRPKPFNGRQRRATRTFGRRRMDRRLPKVAQPTHTTHHNSTQRNTTQQHNTIQHNTNNSTAQQMHAGVLACIFKTG
jgi:hypothetical protein